ncbi:YfhO family protein [Patescibacteria group bacterium]|nr:YfhO family protein [Patescibacteria group bacterium]
MKFKQFIQKHFYLIVLLVLPFMVFWQNFFIEIGRVFFGNDSLLSFYTLASIADQLKSGFNPIWDPYTFFGIPLLSRPDSLVFYPVLGLLAYIGGALSLGYTKFFILMEGVTVLHLSFAGITTYLFLKKLGLKDFSAFIGGLVYMLNGNIVSFMNTTGLLISMTWFPIIFWSFYNLLKSPSMKNCLLFALAFAFPITTFAWQNCIIYHAFFLGAYYLYSLITKETTLKSSAFYCIFGLVTSIALTAIVVLPGLEVPKISDRADLNYGLSAYSGNLKPRQLFDMFIPYMSATNYGEGQTLNLYDDTLPFTYLGVLPLLLLVPAFFKKNNLTIFFAITGVIFFLFAFGGETSVFDIIYNLFLPVMKPFRNVTKVVYLSFFSLSILVAFGVDNLLAVKSEALAYYRKGLVNLLIALFVGMLVLVLRFDQYIWKFSPGPDSINLFSHMSVFAMFLLFTTAAVACFFLLKIEDKRYFMFLAFFTIFFDMALFAKKYPINNYGINPDYLVSENGITKFLNDVPDPYFFRADVREMPHNYASGLRHVNHIDGYLVYRSKIVNKFLNMMPHPQRLTSIDSVGRIKYVVTRADIADPNYKLVHTESVTMANAHLLFTRGDSPSGWVPAPSDLQLKVYENLKYIPYFSFTELLVPSNAEMDQQYLRAVDFDPMKHTLIDTKSNVTGLRTSYEKNDNQKIDVISSKPNEYVLKISTSTPAFINTGHPYYEDWLLEIDGKKTEKLKVNAAFIGFPIDSGTHTVKLYYYPRVFYFGMLISVISLIYVVIGLSFFYIRRPGSPESLQSGS